MKEKRGSRFPKCFILSTARLSHFTSSRDRHVGRWGTMMDASVVTDRHSFLFSISNPLLVTK